MTLFTVLDSSQSLPKTVVTPCILLHSNWDDWFTFNTLYDLWLWNETLYEHIGSLKIGQVNMRPDQRTADLPESFEALDKSIFFSLGTDDVYYENLERQRIRRGVLERLNDIAYSLEAFVLAENQRVTHSSLLRSLSVSTVTSELRRIAQGGSVRTKYRFKYEPPLSHLPVLEFAVDPVAYPPNNIHIFIGRNGVGKTSFLRLITLAVIGNQKYGKLSFEHEPEYPETISAVISVSFSAFDTFPPLPEATYADGIKYAYVGLKKEITSGVLSDNSETEEILGGTPEQQTELLPPALKNHKELTDDFCASLDACMQGARRDRWRTAVNKLYSDPIFEQADVLILSRLNQTELVTHARQLFKRLSSGHQIVLYTVTKLIQLMQDRSLVLFDEPECHLHPPLLSAFVRALSEMLTSRNAIAIIATHSPVVLQEVPNDTVYIFDRSGRSVSVSRPERETFGENVGILTHDVFGLEVAESGFHALIKEHVRKYQNFDDVVDSFDGKLGGEALALIQVLVSRRNRLKEKGEE